MHFTCLTRSFTNARERMGNFTLLGRRKFEFYGLLVYEAFKLHGWLVSKEIEFHEWKGKKKVPLPPPGVFFWISPQIN